MTPAQLIARARSAIGVPTAYWIGQGGVDPTAPSPGSSYSINRMMAGQTPRKQAQLAELAEAAGYPPSRWDETLLACDCSGLSNWVIGVVRGGNGLAWINTDAMVRYRLQRVRQLFHPPSTTPEPATLVVYPSGRRGERYGHVGIVTAVAGGRVASVVHCSPTNFRFGGNHDAIAETDAAVFERHAPLVYLRPKLLDSGVGASPTDL